METLTKHIDNAVNSRDFSALASVFSSNSIGGGEQRSIAAYVVKVLVSNASVLIPGAFQCYPCLLAIETNVLGSNCLPNNPIENGADNTLRQLLFDYYVQQLDFMGAAKILATTRMEEDPNSVYYFSPAEKCNLYITIAECCLQDGGDTVQADVFVTKAGAIVQQDLSLSGTNNPDSDSPTGTTNEHRSLLLRYKYTYARILDANRKFLQAASRYYELSQLHDSEVEDDELLLLLGRAATCAILSSTGTQKQRILGLLYKDPRLSKLDATENYSTHSVIVRKMHKNQILFLKSPQIRNGEEQQVATTSSIIRKFKESLSENHQHAITADGHATIMDRAIIEHNILAVATLYSNIYVKELAFILGMEEEHCMTEKLVAMMIVEGRLKASMDQVDGLISFDSSSGYVPTELLSFDKSITNFCIKLNKISEEISDHYYEDDDASAAIITRKLVANKF